MFGGLDLRLVQAGLDKDEEWRAGAEEVGLDLTQDASTRDRREVAHPACDSEEQTTWHKGGCVPRADKELVAPISMDSFIGFEVVTTERIVRKRGKAA